MIAEEVSMEPVGVSRKLDLMPAGHVNVGASPIRASAAMREAISLRENLKIRHAEYRREGGRRKKSQMWENSHFRSLGSGRIGTVKRYRRYIEGGVEQ